MPRGRVLRVRAGHLANFSGGAAYMPFVVIFSVPASLVGLIVSGVVLSIRSRGIRGPEPEHASGDDLAEFLLRARSVLIGMAIFAAGLAATLTLLGIRLIYGPEPKYYVAAVLLAAGPLLATLLATRTMIRGFARWRSLGRALAAAGGVYAGSLVVFLLLGGLLL